MNEFSIFSKILHGSKAWLAAGVLLALPLQAESVRVSTAHRVAPASVEDLADLGLRVIDNRVELTLQDAIAIALERNLSIDVERFRRSQSSLGITEARGIYDLDFSSVFFVSSDTSPPISALEQTGGELLSSRVTAWNSSFSQLTPFGGTAVLDLNNSRVSSSDAARLFNPSFRLDFDLTLTQPLLRSFGRKVTEQTLVINRNNSAISREAFQSQVESVVSDVVVTYWALVEAQEQLEVAKESLALAKDLDSMNRIQVEVGTLAPLELVQSEAGVATREEAIIRNEAAVEDNADTLRQLLNLDRGELWDVAILPKTDPESEHQKIDFEKAVDDALELRPDIRRQRLSNKNLRLQADVDRNLKRPGLDLQARWGYNAVAGTVAPIEDSEGNLVNLSTGYSDALSDIIDRQAKGWQVSLNFSYPLQNTVAKARSAGSELAVDEGNFSLRALEQQVLTEVRRAARGVETAAKEIESSKVSSRLARENLNAQRKRYENGLSTSFEVLQIQEDLSEADSREVSAVIRYRRAVNTFQQSVGRLLSENGIELDDSDSE
jgi:outer membrane protein TolC